MKHSSNEYVKFMFLASIFLFAWLSIFAIFEVRMLCFGFPFLIWLVCSYIDYKRAYKLEQEKNSDFKLRSYISEQKYAIDVLKKAINDDEKVKKLFSDHRIEL